MYNCTVLHKLILILLYTAIRRLAPVYLTFNVKKEEKLYF